MKIVTIGINLAKEVFAVHGVDVSDHTVLRRQLKRSDVKILCQPGTLFDWYGSLR